MLAVDLANAAAMPEPDKTTDGKESKPSRLEEARHVIEEYARELREIMRKLRQRLH